MEEACCLLHGVQAGRDAFQGLEGEQRPRSFATKGKVLVTEEKTLNATSVHSGLEN